MTLAPFKDVRRLLSSQDVTLTPDERRCQPEIAIACIVRELELWIAMSGPLLLFAQHGPRARPFADC
jgi:hypothetical protein